MKDLNLLYTFEALWRERSVTRAAESLGLTQAAVSSSLKRLREEYADKLFIPVGRHMEPTTMATDLSHHFLDALAMVRRANVTPTEFVASGSQRLFTVRTRDIGEVVCFPHILQSLREVAPGIQLRSVFKPIEETLSGLASGRIDLALGFLPSLETGIHRRLLFEQRYVCAMRAGHPLADQDLDLARFTTHDHLLVEYSGSGHQVLEKGLVNAGLRSRIKVRLPQYLSAPHFIVNSDLLWCAPAILVDRLAHFYPLVAKPLPIALPSFEIALYWHDRFHRDPANKWLRDFIAAQFGKDGVVSWSTVCAM